MTWKHTLDHSKAFYATTQTIADELECEAADLYGAMNAESGVWAAAMNPLSSATGLLQWMDFHYEKWGYTRARFAALPADAQVHYVRTYLWLHRGKLRSAAAVYTAIFLPAFVGEAGNPDYVLCARGEKLGWAYSANAVFDANGDGRITVQELEQAIRRNWVGPRCAEIAERAGITGALPWVQPDPVDVRTTAGIQRVLLRLGYDLGQAGADGVPGRLTRGALISFQRAQGLVQDGIPGPVTRAALLRAAG